MGTYEKIKVCHLISGDLWAGAEVQAFNLIKSLKEEQSIEQYAIVLNEGRLSAELKKSGIETIVIEESCNSFIKIFKLSKKWLKDKEIDILHSNRYKENVIGTLLKVNGSTKHLIQTIHGGQEPFQGIKRIKNAFTGMLNSFVSRFYFDRIVAVSNEIEENIKRKIDPKKTLTIHNSVEISSIKPAKFANDLKNELGIGPNRIIIGAVGRMVPIKGFDILLLAVRKMIETKPEILLLLAGDGPLKWDLEQMAQELNISENVMFTGFREDIIDIINCFDIFLISSHHEGIPTVLLEAMALKIAVVSTNVGGISEVIKDRVSGILVRSGNADVLVDACLRILENPELKASLETNAEVRVREGFTSMVQKDGYVKLYKEIMG